MSSQETTAVNGLAASAGAVDTRELLGLLFERAAAAMSDEELAGVAASTSYARTLAGQAATLAGSLAGLVNNDSCLKGSDRAGSLDEGEDVSAVLHHLSSLFAQIDGVLGVASAAGTVLAWRRKEAAEFAAASSIPPISFQSGRAAKKAQGGAA